VSDLESSSRSSTPKKTERGMVVTLGDVLFDSGQSRAAARRRAQSGKLAERVQAIRSARPPIEGYTDSVGPAASNYDLSQRRANA
jgi:outer membrane protein OmpA-like peptidoglycan-associated protein